MGTARLCKWRSGSWRNAALRSNAIGPGERVSARGLDCLGVFTLASKEEARSGKRRSIFTKPRVALEAWYPF